MDSGARTCPGLTNPRVLLGCLYRCFCNVGINDVSIQPQYRAEDGIPPVLKTRSSYTYELQIDMPDDFTVPEGDHTGRFGQSKVDTVGVFTGKEVDLRRHIGAFSGGKYISLEQQNYIQCQGDLPPWPLPGGYVADNFTNLLNLCAVRWNGGGW